MDEDRKEELDELYDEYKDITEYVSKKEYRDKIKNQDRIKLFLNLINQRQLSKATKNLFWATVFLVCVGGLQFLRDLQGVEWTKGFLGSLVQLGLWIFLIYAFYSILKSIIEFIKNRIWKKKQIIFIFFRTKLKIYRTIPFWFKHIIMGLVLLLIIVPYLSLFSTIIHENAHHKAFIKYGICGDYSPNYIMAIPDFFNRLFHKIQPSGIIEFCTPHDEKLYLELDQQKMEEVNMAGIYASQFLIGLTTGLLFIMSFIILFIILFMKEENLKIIILIYCFFIMLSLILFIFDINDAIRLNLTQPQGDLQRLLALWNCGSNCISIP
jgi:uncharacterized membrane protein YqjE